MLKHYRPLQGNSRQPNLRLQKTHWAKPRRNVKAVNSCQDQFLSSYLLRQKDNGEFRFILNLKKLNEFILSPHFRLEDIRMVKNLITRNCFLASVDLKDAYFLVPNF
nr:unnamed protein product [Callosobruchus chinensis]